MVGLAGRVHPALVVTAVGPVLLASLDSQAQAVTADSQAIQE